MNRPDSAMSAHEYRRAALWAALFAALIYWANWSLHRDPAVWSFDGGVPPQWPTAVDLLIVVPAVFWWLHRRDRRRAWLGAIGLASFGVFAASFVLPDTSGAFWSVLGALRYAGALAIIAAEVYVLAGIVRLVFGLSRDENPDRAIANGIESRLGQTFVARAMTFDARMWLHAFAGARRVWRYAGDVGYGYHLKDGNASNQQGFLILMAIDLPVMHFVLTLWAGHVTAFVVSAATAFGIVLMRAHYRATLRCPISIDHDTLYLRYSMAIAEARVPLTAIAHAEVRRGPVDRGADGVLRLCDAGEPNVRIDFAEPFEMHVWLGVARSVSTLYLGVDNAAAFVADLNARRASSGT